MKIKNVKIVLFVSLLFCSVVKANMDFKDDIFLKEGIKDPDGIRYAAENNGKYREFTYPLNYMGHKVTDGWYKDSGPLLITAPSEIKQLWQEGWTGKGSDILLIDVFKGKYGFHGVTTTMITDLYAPGAAKYGLNFGSFVEYDEDDYTIVVNNKANVIDINGQVITTKKYIKAINYSMGGTWAQFSEDPVQELIKGTYLLKSLDLSDAVIAKAAGNESNNISKLTGDMDSFDSYVWAKDKNIGPRLLLVGAVFDGELTDYTNIPGNDPEIANKFLLEEEYAPYLITRIDGNIEEMGAGTSYAAPRVTAYAAILRQKFPNLNAPQSASILLGTAGYESLKCYPNCPSSQYGKGVANLPRALAPIGNLR